MIWLGIALILFAIVLRVLGVGVFSAFYNEFHEHYGPNVSAEFMKAGQIPNRLAPDDLAGC